MRKLLYVQLLILTLLFSTGCRRLEPDIPPPPIPAFVVTADYQMIIDQTNAERKKKGLDSLDLNPELMKAAALQAHNMGHLNRLSHELPVQKMRSLTDRLDYIGYKWSKAGENIAWNYDKDKVVEGWMNSPGHRRNILGNYKEIGVGMDTNDKGEPYYCQVFGSR